MRHEAVKQKIPELHFKPEGYISSDSAEFLDEFLGFLRSKGLDPESLVFSGFEGKSIAKGEPLPRDPSIYGMNEAGWREAIRLHEENPAGYAKGWYVPCIGLYDRDQLSHLYPHESVNHPINIEETGLTQVEVGGNVYDVDGVPEFIDKRIEFTSADPGEPLANLPPDLLVKEEVAHIDFPEGSPTDALVSLVYIDR